MPKQVLVTGKSGQLGQSIAKVIREYHHEEHSDAAIYGGEFTFVGRDELDLANPQSITDYFADKTFDIIINCAAYTAVDKAESEPELADQINHLAVKQLAEIAKQQNATLTHISTDYVFNGQNYKPYIETDPTDPQGIYGLTKLKGEQAMQAVNPKGCIIRTSWVYSEFGNNFVKTMMKLGKEREQLGIIYDQVGTPTYAGDLARAILDLLCRSEQGEESPNGTQSADESVKIYHFSNEGVCSWYDFAQTIFELSDIECKVNPIETKDYPTPAKRPHYSLMNKAKFKTEFELQVPYWKDSLNNCLKELKNEK